jgi:Flp pilus assembly protein TadG
VSALVRRLARHHDSRGQALVEFSLAIIVFLMMVLGIFDLGRGIYVYNGVSQAAREVARVTAVHPGSPLGTSTQTADRVATQRALVPDMGTPTISCETLYGAVSSTCASGDFVKVTVTAGYTPISLLGLGGPITLSSTSSVVIP